ncbi:cytochrome P450 [Nocardiopsis gilva YIM 90087]|uniref:Cytochrome P450 n=2 Tax=Nocardiopsis gilva TaxID=280236 RepID=A0A223S4H4_9ACTN|nr:cytochrome P450 [Nocardiopsis gilva]ASU83046.1 cytochrome P450 [Nocardiopsis gilva YIM 90087]
MTESAERTTPHTRTAGDVLDMLDPELLSNPFGVYRRLREQTPLARALPRGIDTPVWLATRYADVRTVMSDARFSNDPDDVPDGLADDLHRQITSTRGLSGEEAQYVARSILDLEGADHTRLRKLVSRAFTARRVNELRPRMQEITDRLLDELPSKAADGAVDLIDHFAYPLPITVICELVGIPDEDRQQWHRWSDALISIDRTAFGPALLEGAAYIRDLIGHRRARPTQDLLSALLRVEEEDGDRLTEEELVRLVFTLVIAGHVTTAHLIGNGVLALLTHQDQLARLRADPDLTPRAVHELMRWCGPVLGAVRVRYATDDVEIADTLIHRGEGVLALFASANRDPREFPDPDRLDITREPPRRETHLGFGHGAHYCLGAALARQEAETAFDSLFRRYPKLSLAVPPESLHHRPSPNFRGLPQLPVRLE